MLCLPLFCVGAETAPRSPEQLVRFITYQSGRTRVLPDEQVDFASITSEYWTNFRAAKSLSKFATNSGWLLLAYARIRGEDAYPKLMAMTRFDRLRFLRPSLDRAIALSLGLTSFV